VRLLPRSHVASDVLGRKELQAEVVKLAATEAMLQKRVVLG
jgi:hypothetical protein